MHYINVVHEDQAERDQATMLAALRVGPIETRSEACRVCRNTGREP